MDTLINRWMNGRATNITSVIYSNQITLMYPTVLLSHLIATFTSIAALISHQSPIKLQFCVVLLLLLVSNEHQCGHLCEELFADP